ncbi:hypothetical protein Poly21_24400 [Allorhodopirellula heiligendammensis]|uniref:Uncharacterized protein n=1 Tax=Allorhodopirellula heiligendammensis TaxID=2714739 RepID=A0A5C6BVJ5_9BACT|nr:hypothetical protein Poly21_24400 [Allorhodopirellula heiligendammensis]
MTGFAEVDFYHDFAAQNCYNIQFTMAHPVSAGIEALFELLVRYG